VYAQNQYETQDEYTEDGTLVCPGAVELVIVVENAPVFYEYALRDTGLSMAAPQFSTEIYLPMGIHVRGRRVEQVRFRSAEAGKPASVSIEAVTGEDAVVITEQAPGR
jgi:hypothetical protein